MKFKHKVIKDFQYLSPDKKIFILKSGTILEEYCYRIKSDLIPIDKTIIDNNPEFFEIIDWKQELVSYMKSQKIPQPTQIARKIVPFIEGMMISSTQIQQVTETDPSILSNIDNEKQKLNDIKKELDKYKSELDLRKSKLDQKEQDIKDQDKKRYELDNLKKELDNIELELNAKKIKLNYRDQEITEQEDKIKILNDQFKIREDALNKRESEIRDRIKNLSEKELEIQSKSRELNEKKRNFDNDVLLSSKEIDDKYIELQSKIDLDLKNLSLREKELEEDHENLRKRKLELQSDIEKITQEIRQNVQLEIKDKLKNMKNDIEYIKNYAKRLSEFNHPYILTASNDILEAIKKINLIYLSI